MSSSWKNCLYVKGSLSRWVDIEEKNYLATVNYQLVVSSILIKNEISKLFVVGLDAAHCVNSTIIGAMNRGYKVVAISDAIISDPDTVKIQMLKEYADRGVDILATKDFIEDTTGDQL